MKQCQKCNQHLDESCFYTRPDRKNKTQSYCKQCFNQYCQQRWLQRKADAVNLLGGKCKKCGYDKCLSALHFHHENPDTKEMEWKTMRLKSWAKIVEELKKCVLLCANCHAEFHHESALTSRPHPASIPR